MKCRICAVRALTECAQAHSGGYSRLLGGRRGVAACRRRGLANSGALDRGKQLAVVERLTAIAADAAGDPTQPGPHPGAADRGAQGWLGIAGHANANEELVAAARVQIASLRAAAAAADNG
jgi:hypothetical protein